MTKSATITHWDAKNRIGWFFIRNQRIQIHASILPISVTATTNLKDYKIFFDSNAVCVRTVKGKRNRKITTLDNIIKISKS